MRFVPFTADAFTPLFEGYSKVAYSQWGSPDLKDLMKIFEKNYGELLAYDVEALFRSRKQLVFRDMDHREKVMKALQKAFSKCEELAVYNSPVVVTRGHMRTTSEITTCSSCNTFNPRFYWTDNDEYTCDSCRAVDTNVMFDSLKPKQLKVMYEQIKKEFQSNLDIRRQQAGEYGGDYEAI